MKRIQVVEEDCEFSITAEDVEWSMSREYPRPREVKPKPKGPDQKAVQEAARKDRLALEAAYLDLSDVTSFMGSNVFDNVGDGELYQSVVEMEEDEETQTQYSNVAQDSVHHPRALHMSRGQGLAVMREPEPS